MKAIGWMRLCRPGSVLGSQQYWLVSMEPKLHSHKIISEKTRYAATSDISSKMKPLYLAPTPLKTANGMRNRIDPHLSPYINRPIKAQSRTTTPS